MSGRVAPCGPGGPAERSAAPGAIRTLSLTLLLAAAGAACSTLPASSSTTTTPGAATFAVVGQPAPAGTGPLEAVSCGSPRICWAVGQTLSNFLSAAAGTPAKQPASTVVVDTTVDSGLHWRAERVPVTDPTDLAAVDCPDSTHCMAVGESDQDGPVAGAVLVTSDGGRIWKSVAAPVGSVEVSALHCTAPGHCLVLATNGTSYWSATTLDGGETWQRTGTLPAGFAGITSAACTSATRCVTVGYVSTVPGQGTGAAAVTGDGGMTWTAATVPAGIGLLHGVACPTAGSCIAVGTASTTTTEVSQGRGEIIASSDGGSTWRTMTAPAGIDDASSISCPTALSCATVGTVWTPTSPPTPIGGVVTTSDGGATWRPLPERYVPEGLTGVDCPTATPCVTAGNDVLARMDLPAPRRLRAAT